MTDDQPSPFGLRRGRQVSIVVLRADVWVDTLDRVQDKARERPEFRETLSYPEHIRLKEDLSIGASNSIAGSRPRVPLGPEEAPSL